jgi:3',5'-nucleoside bisphosphate phosphatase
LIDLHSHTTASDGSLVPSALVEEAVRCGLRALAITDHDTFRGFDEAAPFAKAAGLDLICGVEVSARTRTAAGPGGKSVHLLAYFPSRLPSDEFRHWLTGLQFHRKERNQKIAHKLQGLGIGITDEDLRGFGSNPGRPHFAHYLVDKGYSVSFREAFNEYLSSAGGRAYVDRVEPPIGKAIHIVREAGGIPSLAHPVRLSMTGDHLCRFVEEARDEGLLALEAYHSDHTMADMAYYVGLAQRFGLAVTGGSDFHGATKPTVRLGTGISGNLSIPPEILDRLRELSDR